MNKVSREWIRFAEWFSDQNIQTPHREGAVNIGIEEKSLMHDEEITFRAKCSLRKSETEKKTYGIL
jgi:hypothetical protein